MRSGPPRCYGSRRSRTLRHRRDRRSLQQRRRRADPLPTYVRSMASPNGLPSVSRQMLHRSPGWMTSPPSSRTRFSAASMSGTEKYGRDTRSPGPDPLGWRPRAEPPPWVCQPSPSPSRRPSSSTSKTPFQNRRARAGSSAGNSTNRSGEVTSPRYDSPCAACDRHAPNASRRDRTRSAQGTVPLRSYRSSASPNASLASGIRPAVSKMFPRTSKLSPCQLM